MEHLVEVDTAGWGNRPRVTCFSCTKTLLKSPWMTDVVWCDLVINFVKEHPNQTGEEYKEQLKKSVA